MFPSDSLLSKEEGFVEWRVLRGIDGWVRPVLEAQEEKTFCVRGAVPLIAVITDGSKELTEGRLIGFGTAREEVIGCFDCVVADGA